MDRPTFPRMAHVGTFSTPNRPQLRLDKTNEVNADRLGAGAIERQKAEVRNVLNEADVDPPPIGILFALSEVVADAYQYCLDVVDRLHISLSCENTNTESDCLCSEGTVLAAPCAVLVPLSIAIRPFHYCPVPREVESFFRVEVSDMGGLIFFFLHDATNVLFPLDASQLAHIFVAGSSLLSAWSCIRRFECSGRNRPEDSIVQHRAAMLLCIIGCIHSYLSTDCLVSLEPYFRYPELTVRCVMEMIAQPVLLLNFGYLCGRPFSGLRSEIMWSVLFPVPVLVHSVSCSVTTSLFFGVLPVAFVVAKLCGTVRTLQKESKHISQVNKFCSSLTGDILVFCWCWESAIATATISGFSDPSSASIYSSLLDVIGKIGMCHLSLKSSQALENARVSMERTPRSE
eukprot:TRINITY_DN64878_c0_g1_i1.p1 TRINITY_DN64878_c0_g1~~TRINITY_DN64878_c0_g1_i1.p1  ORF type:complete len:401 (+),score=22.46 TRINITY_DN64878_c0_g1_i1:193-1395(+)